MADLWEYDISISDYDINQPAWITEDLTAYDVAAIIQGGCESGAYMPAVTYNQALQTMTDHGNDVTEYIETSLGEMPAPKAGEGWAQMATYYLSMAVELYCSSIEDELSTAIDSAKEDNDDE